MVTGTEQYVSGRETVTVGTLREKTGERDVVVGRQLLKTGTVTRLEQEERKLVGLVKSDDYGVGYLEILDRLSAGGNLPAGYIDRLFGKVDGLSGKDGAAASRAKGVPATVRDAYGESVDLAARDAMAVAARDGQRLGQLS